MSDLLEQVKALRLEAGRGGLLVGEDLKRFLDDVLEHMESCTHAAESEQRTHTLAIMAATIFAALPEDMEQDHAVFSSVISARKLLSKVEAP